MYEDWSEIIMAYMKEVGSPFYVQGKYDPLHVKLSSGRCRPGGKDDQACIAVIVHTEGNALSDLEKKAMEDLLKTKNPFCFQGWFFPVHVNFDGFVRPAKK